MRTLVTPFMITLVLGTSNVYAALEDYLEEGTATHFPKFVTTSTLFGNAPLANTDVANFRSGDSGIGSYTTFLESAEEGQFIANGRFEADAWINTIPDTNGIYDAEGIFIITGSADLGNGFVCASCRLFSGTLERAAFTDLNDDDTNDTIMFETANFGGLLVQAGFGTAGEVLSFEQITGVDFSSIDGFGDAFDGTANAITVVPVPAALLLFASALLGLVTIRRRGSGNVVPGSAA